VARSGNRRQAVAVPTAAGSAPCLPCSAG
jgi:hypothetical protein